MTTDPSVIAGFRAAGFSETQARFLAAYCAPREHTHTAGQIIMDPSDGETLDDWTDRASEVLADLEEESEAETADADGG